MNNTLDIYRAGNIIHTLEIDLETEFNGALMSDQYVTCSVKVEDELDIQYEDYIIERGAVYKVNKVPQKQYDGSVYKYVIKFDSIAESLKNEFFKFEGDDAFPLFASPEGFVTRLVESLNADDPGYTVGQVDDGIEMLIEFDGQNHLEALTMIAQKFGFEYSFTGKAINLVKTVGVDTGLLLAVGRQKGLYTLQLEGADNKNVITRAYGVGGTRNLDYTYRPGVAKNGKLMFEGKYLESNVDLYKVKAGKYINEDIYPKSEGTITAVTTTVDVHSVVDSLIDFDLNPYIQDGLKAKINFKSGELMNQTFDIRRYDAATKTIYFEESKDSNGYVLPNDQSQPQVGDQYALLDIRLPQAKIDAAEALLKSGTLTYLMQNNVPQVLYSLELDEKFIRDNGAVLNIGDKVGVKNPDPVVGAANSLRFTGINYPLVNRSALKATISNFVPYNQQDRLVAKAIETTKQFETLSSQTIAKARREAFVLRQLEESIFDTDGKFDQTKINVGVLITALGIFGIKSQDLLLNEVLISTNYQGNKNSVNVSGGQLIHLEIEIPGLGSIWNMTGTTRSDLVDDSLYYIYAKCSKISLTGEFVLSSDQIKLEDVSGSYMFLLGVVTRVKDNSRDANMTYGITTISGRQIKTGLIEGFQSSWNLDTGTFFGRFTFTSSGGTVKDVAIVDNTATLAQANALAAQTLADNALAQLADYANDGILDVSEKIGALKDFRAIAATIDSREAQGLTYGLSIVDIDTKYHALVDYVTPLFNDMSVNSPIVRDTFIAKFNDYYKAEQLLLQAITDAANAKINSIDIGVNYSAGKMLYTDPEFSGSYGQSGFNGINIYNNLGNGSVTINRGINYADFPNAGYPANPNSSGCYLGLSYYGAGASPGYGGFTFATQTRANAVFITRIVALIPVGRSIQWASNDIGTGANGGEWLTSRLGTGKWEEYLCKVTCGVTGTFSSTNYFFIDSGSNTSFSWFLSYATVFDMTAAPADPLKYADVQMQAAITQANATAASIAQSEANIAKAAALSQASTDAQAKADAAYNASVTASNSYAATAANSAASAAQVNAAADASNKATAAYNNAIAAAQAQYNALTASLKGLAYQDIVQLAQLGNTVIENGMIKTTLLDANYIRSNIINAAYINALSIDAGAIQTGTLSANRIDVANLIVQNLRTATPGTKHVEINGVDNNVRVVSANSDVLIELDDDSVTEGWKLGHVDGQPPVVSNVYGPGISISNPAADQSKVQLGRLGFTQLNQNGTLQNFIGTELAGGVHSVQLDATGGLSIYVLDASGNAVKGRTGLFNIAGTNLRFKDGMLIPT